MCWLANMRVLPPNISPKQYTQYAKQKFKNNSKITPAHDPKQGERERMEAGFEIDCLPSIAFVTTVEFDNEVFKESGNSGQASRQANSHTGALVRNKFCMKSWRLHQIARVVMAAPCNFLVHYAHGATRNLVAT